MSARKLIFFPKKWGQNSITQDTKDVKSKVKIENWRSLRWRQDRLSFLHSFSAGFNSQDTKPLNNSKENRKSNDGAIAPRRIYLFPQSCRRVQLLKIIWLVPVKFEQILDVYTLIFVSSTYRVYFIIFFLKSAGFSIKKGTILLTGKEWFAFCYFKVDDWTRHGLLDGCTEPYLHCSSYRDAHLLRLALPSPRFGRRHRQVLLLWVTQGHSHTCPR